MYWPDEIRAARFPELEGDIDVRDQELKMAQTLIANLTEDFDPKQFSDTYREALMAAVQQKIEGKEIVAPAAAEEAPQVVDLTEALKRSLEEVKARSGSSKKASGE
jgi:DNA end-binding protein Ku